MHRSSRRRLAPLVTLLLALALVPVGTAGARGKDPRGGSHRPDPHCHRVEAQQRGDQSALASAQAKLKKAKSKQVAARTALDAAVGEKATKQAQAKLKKAKKAVKTARAKVAAAKADVKDSNADAKHYGCGG